MKVTVRLTDAVLPGTSPVLMVLPNGTRRSFIRPDRDRPKVKPVLEHECEIPVESVSSLIYDGYEVLVGGRQVDPSKLPRSEADAVQTEQVVTPVERASTSSRRRKGGDA